SSKNGFPYFEKRKESDCQPGTHCRNTFTPLQSCEFRRYAFVLSFVPFRNWIRFAEFSPPKMGSRILRRGKKAIANRGRIVEIHLPLYNPANLEDMRSFCRLFPSETRLDVPNFLLQKWVPVF